MAKHLQPFSIVVLFMVLSSLPALQGSRRTLQALAPVPWPHRGVPIPAPSPTIVPSPTPTPKLSPTHPPPRPGSGGSGGGDVPPPKKGGGSSGLSGGQKAGIVIGVLAAAGLIGFATVVYMKRQSNIQRARFGESARRSQL